MEEKALFSHILGPEPRDPLALPGLSHTQALGRCSLLGTLSLSVCPVPLSQPCMLLRPLSFLQALPALAQLAAVCPVEPSS